VNVIGRALRPGLAEAAHGGLGLRSEAIRRPEEDVIEVPVAVEVEREHVAVTMTLEGAAVRTSTDEFPAHVRRATAAEAAHRGAVEQLGLR
jgi:hypothetical protein